jgi:2'-5' RNA ligase
VHRLFFAIQPDAAAAANHLSGKPQQAERLHVTLHWLRDHAGLPPGRT